jgi:Zn-dependent oligopeptidase
VLIINLTLLLRRCAGALQSKLFAAEGSNVRLPVAHMVCNQMPPVGEKPSLMTFREVESECDCVIV